MTASAFQRTEDSGRVQDTSGKVNGTKHSHKVSSVRELVMNSVIQRWKQETFVGSSGHGPGSGSKVPQNYHPILSTKDGR